MMMLQFSHATDNITLFLRGVCNYFSMLNNSLFLVLAKIYNYTGRMQYNNAIQNVFFLQVFLRNCHFSGFMLSFVNYIIKCVCACMIMIAFVCLHPK